VVVGGVMEVLLLVYTQAVVVKAVLSFSTYRKEN
jgi:hypothetical protein